MAFAATGVTLIFNCDTDGMAGGTGTLDGDVYIEGAGSLKLKVSNTLGSVAKYDQNATGVDMSGKHFGIWVMTPASLDTDTNGGIRCYFEDTSGNWKECYVSGSDSYPGGWSYLVCSYDATGTPRARPTSITMSILNLLHYDWATCFRLVSEGGALNKTEYSATGGEIIGDTTLTVDGTIAADVPGKAAGGSLMIKDVSDSNQEYVLRFSSYVTATGVVTLANIDIASAAAGTGTTTVVTTGGGLSTAKVGDLVYNHDIGAVSYVTEVTDTNTVQIYPAITGQDPVDHIELNCIPIAVNTADDVYFAIVFIFKESDGTASASMQFVSTIYSKVTVRNTSDAAVKIKGYTAAVIIGSGGGTASATRIENTVYGS